MSAQEPKSKRNFIAILSDSSDEQSTVESLNKSDWLVRRIFLGLMAAMRNCTSKVG